MRHMAAGSVLWRCLAFACRAGPVAYGITRHLPAQRKRIEQTAHRRKSDRSCKLKNPRLHVSGLLQALLSGNHGTQTALHPPAAGRCRGARLPDGAAAGNVALVQREAGGPGAGARGCVAAPVCVGNKIPAGEKCALLLLCAAKAAGRAQPSQQALERKANNEESSPSSWHQEALEFGQNCQIMSKPRSLRAVGVLQAGSAAAQKAELVGFRV